MDRPLVEKRQSPGNQSYWQNKAQTPTWHSWAGYAFEGICYKHADRIRHTLGLDQIACESGSWKWIPPKGAKEKGAQIDLLLDCDDGVIYLCEIKYSTSTSSHKFRSHLPSRLVI